MRHEQPARARATSDPAEAPWDQPVEVDWGLGKERAGWMMFWLEVRLQELRSLLGPELFVPSLNHQVLQELRRSHHARRLRRLRHLRHLRRWQSADPTSRHRLQRQPHSVGLVLPSPQLPLWQ